MKERKKTVLRLGDLIHRKHIVLAKNQKRANAKCTCTLNGFNSDYNTRLIKFVVFHNEAIVRNGEIVSVVTSGNYGHAIGAGIAMGYVPCAGETAAEVLASTYEIEIAGDRVAAEPSLKPLYDPKSLRIHGSVGSG